MAGLSTDRLQAMNEMIMREKKHRIKHLNLKKQVEYPSYSRTMTGVDWIGLNPDPCRYRLERQERMCGNFFQSVRLPEKTIKTQSIKPESSAQIIGWGVNEGIPKNTLTQVEISAPSSRGTFRREMYKSSSHGIL